APHERTRAGSKLSTSSTVPDAQTGPSVPMTHAAVWNIGSGFTKTEPDDTAAAAIVIFATVTSERWRSSTPFGFPVVPEVYCSMAGSPGSTSGSAPDAVVSQSV